MAKGQCVALGPNSASTAVNNTVTGSMSWSGLTNLSVSDGSYASVLAVVPGTSNYMVMTNFGFSVAATATICGIFVEIQKSAAGLFPGITDNSVKIVKGGVITGSDQASSTAWPSTSTYFSYGSSSSNWGTTWLPSDINASNFGVSISATLAGTLLPTARIDNVRITVYYNNTILPIELTDFNVERTGSHSAVLSWGTATELNNQFFIVQRSSDGTHWTSLGQRKGAGTSHVHLNYTYTDTACPDQLCYFRLKQEDDDASFHYSPVVAVFSASPPDNQLHIIDDPGSGSVQISSSTTIVNLSLCDLSGRKLEDISPGEGIRSLTLFLENRKTGIYVLNVTDVIGNHYVKKIFLE